MNAAQLLDALALPPEARVDRRIPKTALQEFGALSAADKRHVNEGIERLQWIATLKPTNVGVASYRDPSREYLEIAVLRLVVRTLRSARRIVTIVHRSVPHPVVLVSTVESALQLSLAHKRWARNETDRSVLDGDVLRAEWIVPEDAAFDEAFAQAMALNRQPRMSLYALYQGWADVLHAREAARVTGSFHLARTPSEAAARRAGLVECAHIEAEMSRVTTAATRTKQIARQVELNLELKRLKQAYIAAQAQL